MAKAGEDKNERTVGCETSENECRTAYPEAAATSVNIHATEMGSYRERVCVYVEERTEKTEDRLTEERKIRS